MIQYQISREELEQLIEQEKPGWLERANQRTQEFADQGYYEESSSIWSEVKVVFVRIQNNKCAYCEKLLESEEYGLIEYDLEHFRPKKKAKPWKLPKDLKDIGIVLTPPLDGPADRGYHLLAYNPLNYNTSCKTCNSRLKSDYFPISGVRSPEGDDPVQLLSEDAYLVNPVGNFDDDPASLIKFHGISPVACGDSDFQYKRGLVTISFFHLDDLKRKSLLRNRADIITKLYLFLQSRDQATDDSIRNTYNSLINIAISPKAPHSNCAKSYYDLYNDNPIEATEIFQHATEYLNSISN